jgi:EmrB/QacA subfamily drug resistance transporter
MGTKIHTNEQDSREYTNRWKALLFIGISLLVIALDNTILNVALPSISRDLGASASELQWIVDAYILVFAALVLTMGSIGDRVGRKKALQIGLVLFGVGSLAAALAPSTKALIAARAFLGIGGAIIMPATLSIITASFRDEKERSQAIALWAAIFGLGVGLGPVIGGWLLQRFGWNAVFLINLPVVAVALAGGYLFIAESKDTNTHKLDVPGVILSVLGLFALVYGIIEAGVVGWTDPNVLRAFGAAAFLLGAFTWWESRAASAMLPLSFFKNMSFTGANLALVLLMFSMYGAVFFLSQYFQSVQGYSALNAGLLLFPLALLVTVGSALSARVSGRFGIKITVAAGILLAAVGLFAMSQVSTVDAAYVTLFPSFGLFALGLGLAMPPATDSVMGAVPVDKAGVGSAMNDTTRQLGGALGVAVLGTIMNNVYIDQVALLKDKLQLPTEAWNAISSSIQGAHFVANSVQGALVQTIQETANQAFVTGMTDAMRVGALILGLAAVITFVILPSRVYRSEDEAAVTSVREVTIPVPSVGD